MYPGDKVRLQAAKQAAATKGTSFVIDEIGEVSDDEENYGTYQGDVMKPSEYVKEENDEREHKGGCWFDEYYLERTTKHDVKSRPPD